MHVTDLNPDLKNYFDELDRHLPVFSLEDQRTALVIYRELARGEPLEDDRLASALGVDAREVRRRRSSPAIRSFTYPDPEDRIVGFGGLAVAPMHHELVVQGRRLWTWCACDSLFIPELLGASARITSADPVTDRPVRLHVSVDRLAGADPADAVISFVRPEAEVFAGSAENVMASFCHYVFFFESVETGTAWIGERPGTFLCSLEQGVALAKRLNRRNFGQVLSG